MMTERSNKRNANVEGRSDQRGTATLTAVMILALLAVFTAATLSRVTTEALVMGNDYSHTKAFYAAQAGLELMSRDFNKIFDVQLRPSTADLDRIRAAHPEIDGFTFTQDINQGGASGTKPIEDGPFSGLVSVRTPWELMSVGTYANGAQTQLTRTFFNHQIPIFQFGIFYNDDMELHPGPTFNFGGRVHANGNLFLASGSNLYFRSRVTAVGEVLNDTSRMGARKGETGWSWDGKIWVADSAGTFREVIRGSVVKASGVQATDPDMPNWAANTTWSEDLKVFSGNLQAKQPALRLPLQIGTNDDPVEIVKRGVNGDSGILRDSRYFNKPCIRISLSDSQARLPGGTGGVRLDGKWDGLGGNSGSEANAADGTRGYMPKPMADGYQAKRVNGHRLYTGASYTDDGMPANRQTWIKVEIVTQNNLLQPVATDKTEDFLSLGVTHKDPNGLNIGDARAIIKLQRYEMLGPPIKVAAANLNNTTATAVFTSKTDSRDASSRPVYSYNSTGTAFNYVATSQKDTSPDPDIWRVTNWAAATQEGTAQSATDTAPETDFEETVTIGTVTYRVVPFPIKIYSSREGLYNEDLAVGSSTSTSADWFYLYTGTSPGTALGTTFKVPVVGVMSVVDLDMGNLDRFLSGVFDAQFPGGLTAEDVPDNGGAGCIVYVSDRRGDRDNDGEYDMEDVYGPNDGVMQPGEDVNKSGVIEADYDWEAARYNVSLETDVAAVTDGKYFRRAVRVINGSVLTLWGTLNRGFSVASENGLYTLGDYNATGISAVGTPTQPAQYTGAEVPTSLVADAVTILSKEWRDAKSFRNPCQYGTRTVSAAGETAVRAALLMGDSRSSLRTSEPDQGGGDANLSGGVHNFPRFLESWGTRFNYCGSLINLFNSRQHDGAHKNGNKTYSPPTRNWVFNTAFLDINRLPPGTPFFQYIQMTGFRQTVRQLQ
jgi:hypothetical protein